MDNARKSTTLWSLITIFFFSTAYANPPPYLIGSGIYDITGAAAEIDMMGYANLQELDNGIHSRLWARAFVVVDKNSKRRIVFVNNDLGMVFQSIKQGVIKKLGERFGSLYNDRNVMLSATHTHAGPGGYAYHTLFNLTVRGFYRQNYDAIVNGIVEAITQAHNNLEPGTIFINKGTLSNTAKNRSIEAYNKNPQDERDKYAHTTDKSMTLLKFVNGQGEAIGTVNWHAVHGVSMSNKNKLISGDNKGYAAYLFEQAQGSDYQKNKTFVAAFAQANEGDSSPNIFPLADDGNCDKFDCNDIKRTQIIGQRQFEKARELFQSAQQPLTGDVDFRHQYLAMENTVVDPEFTDGRTQHTCAAALGYPFAAGTSDGAGVSSIFHPGQVKGNPLVNWLRDVIAKPTQALEECQKPKAILLAVGLNKPAWIPQHMPVQLFKIGKLLIAGVPGEFSTMAGRRLKTMLKEKFQHQVDTVVIAGLSNSYAGYVTTPEEYEQQNYEGGFTAFGKWTFSAYLQGFSHIANDMLNDQPSLKGATPENLETHTGSLIPPVLFDSTPVGVNKGDPFLAPNDHYQKGDEVHVIFWGGHPRNNLRTMQGFLKVQRLDKDRWVNVAHDWDWSTIYRWQRISIAESHVHIFWKIPKDTTKPGQYRIIHNGHYKSVWTRKIHPYQGVSNVFTVE